MLTFALRAIGADQPIVENYVGRQIPTAMVARNLDRGSGFFRPQLDTAPFPNLFLVEPPLYPAAVVGLLRATGLGLEPAGRIVSALATALGAWGLFGLARRREGVTVALLAVAAFALFPLTIRYGRAFQPDAMMLGGVLVGLRCWDEHEAGNGRGWLVLGWLALATGLALKIVWASVLVPLIAVVLRPRRSWKVALAFAVLVPATLWYVHAAFLLAEGAGSKASGDNGAIWLRVLVPWALLRGETWTSAAWVLGVRAFTPIGAALALWGMLAPRGRDLLWTGPFGSPTFPSPSRERVPEGRVRASDLENETAPSLWPVWGASTLFTLAILAGKLHHEYYWMALAPVVAVEVGRGLTDLSARGTWGTRLAVSLGGAAVGLAGLQSASTWRTPKEWGSLPTAAAMVQTHVPEDAWVVAPEALLFASDRRGCRLEFSRGSVLRAAGEWGETLEDEGPLALVEFYRERGAAYFADVGDAVWPVEPARLALHEAIRRRYKVLVDRPGVLLAALDKSGEPLMPGDESAVTLLDFARWKGQGRKISVLTAYDFTSARLLDAAGIDCLLVGDSLGTAVQGWNTTLRVTLDQMIYHAEMVARAAKRALVVADLPFLSYQASPEQAILSAGRYLKETECKAVKLEGGRRMGPTIRALVESGIPVMGHVGLTPQSVRRLGGFRVQRDGDEILADARAVADSGAFALVLECIPRPVASRVTAELPIPTIGIGAGPDCDGQVLVTPDLLGLLEDFRPRFVRRYAELGTLIREAAAAYIADVGAGRFPSESESFE